MIVFIRAILLYLLIIFCLRLMGKRQIGELQPSELVITILVSNIAAMPIEDTSIPMLAGAVPILVLVAFELIISSISLHSKRFRTIVSGKPLVVIRDGEIDQEAMRKLRFSIDDLMESLRAKDIFDVQDVYYAVVETTGKMSIQQKFKARNVTAEMLELKGSDVAPPVVVISDGQLLPKQLETYNVGAEWVEKTLLENKMLLSEVFLMTVDPNRAYYIVPKMKAPAAGKSGNGQNNS